MFLPPAKRDSAQVLSVVRGIFSANSSVSLRHHGIGFHAGTKHGALGCQLPCLLHRFQPQCHSAKVIDCTF